MATGNLRRNVPDYTGAGGAFRRDLDSIEDAVYDARTRDRARQERLTRDRLRAQEQRNQEAQRFALAEAHDQENRERMKQTKAQEKQRCIAAGMTLSDFEQTYWPRRKFEIIKERIDVQARAQATHGMYHNIL
jgi:hypothetical protein